MHAYGAIIKVAVLEAATGVCLFEREREGHKSSKDLTGLIRAFVQFSREIDTGNVSRVLFQRTETPCRPVPGSYRRTKPSRSVYAASPTPFNLTTPRTAPAASTLAAASAAAQQQDLSSIEMVCARDSRIIIAVFHDRSVQTQDAQRFAHMMLHEFTVAYGAGLDTMKALLRSVASGSASAEEAAQITGRFADFEGTVAAFTERVFRSSTAHAPAQHAPASSSDHSGPSTPEAARSPSPSTPPPGHASPSFVRLSLNDPQTPNGFGRSSPPPGQEQSPGKQQQHTDTWPPEIDCDWPPDLT
eukprot:tig00000663_g2948.t1